MSHEWVIKTVVRPTDLRTVSWQANTMHLTSSQYKLKPGQAVLFVNKAGDKGRILVKSSEQVHTLIMLPVDPKGLVWGDRFNAALIAGQWVEERMPTNKTAQSKKVRKVLTEWLDELAPKSDRVRAYQRRGK
jgi:hypothetical protein